MNAFFINGTGLFDRFIHVTNSVRVWLTRDRTGLQLWRIYPSFDEDANAFYGGEMLHLLDHGQYDIAMNSCVAIDIPLTLHHNSGTPL